MHNLVEKCSIKFNDLEAASFTSEYLDFNSAFMVSSSKKYGYNNMIGNVRSLTTPVGPGESLPSMVLNLPLPFFFSRDSGVALPTAALPYNDMRIEFHLRELEELLVVENSAMVPAAGVEGFKHFKASFLKTGEPTPKLTNCAVWANYAIVGNAERKSMACESRDILIEQVQTFKRHYPSIAGGPTPFDLRFSHAIKALFFAIKNSTNSADHSNYTTHSPVISASDIDFTASGQTVDPIKSTTLTYENSTRLSMGSDYYSISSTVLSCYLNPGRKWLSYVFLFIIIIEY